MRSTASEITRRLWQLAAVLRTQGIAIELTAHRYAGRVVAEDDVQVAVIPKSR
ncbi:hypothetical protein BH09MYX1_BH09MYX1_23670 [soil metagenome]